MANLLKYNELAIFICRHQKKTFGGGSHISYICDVINDKQTISEQEMKTISKTCKTMKEAEIYQNAFCKMYHYVELVSFPMYDECGIYVWKVCK